MVVSEFRGFKFYANDRGHWGPIQEHGVQVFCILLDVAKAFGFMNDSQYLNALEHYTKEELLTRFK